MNAIDAAILDRLPLDRIEVVAFYKLDQITVDLICSAVQIDGETWSFHEEQPGWDLLLRHVGKLPGFRQDWYAAVVQPPFAENRTVAYERAAEG